MKTMQREAGFTIAELVAILFVICCLMLVIVPAFAKSEGRGLGVACRTNQRLMMSAFHLYADENNSFFPDNQEISKAWIRIWEPSQVTNTLHPENFAFAPYVPPGKNILKCPADQSIPAFSRRDIPRIRSISMNHAVGTKASSGPQKAPVDGYWLDGGGHTANRQFYCYGKLSDMVAPTPAGLWVFSEENPDSINDGAFASIGPLLPNQHRIIDFPGAWHDGAAMLGFADGHVEEKRWLDPRTVPRRGEILNVPSPNNPDIAWLGNRTTAPVPR